ncbi:DNA-methyltransferase [Mycetocola reblochoni]|uniref:Methyltransferase n=2 Tax=Mycetocola reblochoni TaxID=331618 RepID=A0A1R4IR88_9MICO|nr:site-specific DNA-methyltransferase [Mycetocola reblochoni]SJN22347.1 Adenine-specific methyltransferase [Mycetocola reblochoni REB411]
MPDASVDAIVTDPPYELGFMGKGWDSSGIAYDPEVWAQALRVLKPGGHLLAFGATRTWHRLAVAVEDAGFEIRESIAWMYGSGFPKSMDVAKAIDKAAGIRRGRAGAVVSGNGAMSGGNYERTEKGAPATAEAEKWAGWGTALKPAFEPVVVARKPSDGTVAANVLAHGTGALNIDASRIGRGDGDRTEYGRDKLLDYAHERVAMGVINQTTPYAPHDAGRFPSNVILDESQAAELDKQTGVTTSRKGKPRSGKSGDGWGMTATGAEYDDIGGASRFFYVAKAGADERPVVDGVAHATVKPLALMRYLVRLITPPGGTVLDPFAGSGTTLEAALIEGFNAVGIELEADHLPLIRKRLGTPIQQSLFGDWSDTA